MGRKSFKKRNKTFSRGKNRSLSIAQIVNALAQLSNPNGSALGDISSYLLGRYEACYPDKKLLQKQLLQVIQHAIEEHVLVISNGRVSLSLKELVPIGTRPLTQEPQSSKENEELKLDWNTNVPTDRQMKRIKELPKLKQHLERLALKPGEKIPNPFIEPVLNNNMESMCQLIAEGKAV